MMLLLRGAAFTASKSTLSVSGLDRSVVGRMTPLRLPARDALAGGNSGAPSPHTPSP